MHCKIQNTIPSGELKKRNWILKVREEVRENRSKLACRGPILDKETNQLLKKEIGNK